ncbi:hypothetical protein FFF34_019555 [Inquilinus sp. KBS0705]|nr:hypothetical protein FFF34_019555 [Inquilinus sp. KBS0705]
MDSSHLTIDVDRSIDRQRLIYKSSFSLYFEYFSRCLLASCMFFLGNILIQAYEIPDPLATIIIIFLSIWLLGSLYFINKLNKIIGLNDEGNKLKVAAFLHDKFDNITCIYSSHHIYIYINEPKPIGITKIITLLFYNNEVYLNISTLNKKTDSKMFLSATYDYFKAKNIQKILAQQLNPMSR